MLSIHTNYTSLLTQNNLNKTSGAMDQAMQRISTGFRINSASDDAAGLQIATRLQSQSNGLATASRNSQDAISMLQTAEGAFDEMTNIAHRMKDLATQAANGTNQDSEHEAMQAEWNALASELESVLGNTQYGSGNSLFGNYDWANDANAPAGDGTSIDGGLLSQGISFQIGASTDEKLGVDVSTKLEAIFFAVGTADSDGSDPTAPVAEGLFAADLATNADGAMDAIDALLNNVGSVRSELGANINRLDHTVVNLGNMRENTEMAKGRIMDTDYAVESSNMMKNQMLTQMSMSMLSQANGMSGMVMSLI
ncbi:lateral flagellin LafA [Vibrio astriarenae]